MINKQCVVFVNTLRKSHPHINYSNYLLYLPHTETMRLQYKLAHYSYTDTELKLLTIRINKVDIKLYWTPLIPSNFHPQI